MGSKFGRIFSLLGGGSKTSTEESFDFLDSDVDEVILYHELAMGCYNFRACSGELFVYLWVEGFCRKGQGLIY